MALTACSPGEVTKVVAAPSLAVSKDGWGWGQGGLLGDVPAHGRGVN